VAEDRNAVYVTDLPAARIEFPDGFAWGAASAAHQVEGGNWNNDWWAWEHDPRSPCTEPSGDACDHYHRFTSDFELYARLGHNAHRFSLEWSRIEPEPGEFSNAALDHYARVIDSLHDNGLTPFVTLHHFTSPRWVHAHGGWASEAIVDRFRRYSETVARRLGERIPFVCTINEPQIVAIAGYQGTGFPPGVGDRALFWPVTRNFIAAHAAALASFGEHAPSSRVGLVCAVSDWQAADEESRELRDRVHHRMVQVYYDALRTGVVAGPSMEEEIAALGGASDFVGVNYYSRTVLRRDEGVVAPPPGAEITQMGYEVVPDCFTPVLVEAMTSGLPIYVTENGIGTADDRQRIRYIATHVAAVRRAIDEGADVRGYIHWCAMDNFEWTFGFARTFGLIECNRQTFERTPKPSAEYFAEICRTNAVDPAVTAEFLSAGNPLG
jgi:beta-glucosidase